MASMTIRNFDDQLKRRLRMRAAAHGRSVEAEVREILRAELSREQDAPRDLASAIRKRFASVGEVELDLPPREPIPEPVRFKP